MIDERTPNLSLPLPHPENLLEEDVGRIRQALAMTDAALAEQQAQRSAGDAQLAQRLRQLRLRQFHRMDF